MLKFRNRFVLLIVMSGMLYSTIAESALIRGGGRGSKTSTAPQSYYLIDAADTVMGPYGVTLSASNFDSVMRQSPNYGFTSGNQHLLPVPGRDCYEEMDYDTYNSIPPQYLPVWDGCSYAFYDDENLFAFGSFFAYLVGAASYDITWTLSNAAGQMWQFTGDDSYIDHAGGSQLIYYDDWGSPVYSDKGMVFLNAAIPFDMPVGEYDITLDVTMQSGTNKTFFYYQDEHNALPVDCITVTDPDDFCFVSSGLYASDTLTFSVNSGFTETVRIMARVENVSAPAMLGSWAIAVLFTIRRRRVKQ